MSTTGSVPRANIDSYPDSDNLEVYSDAEGATTIFEDWSEGDFRNQRLVKRAPTIDQSLGDLGERGRKASIVFAGPLLDELPHDCRTWFDADFTCLIAQGWFRSVRSDGTIFLQSPDVTQIAGPWDLIVMSHLEAEVVSDLEDWKRLSGILAVTHGSEGATVFAHGEEHHISAITPPEIIDPTGAGDVWSAAFTFRYLETQSIREAGGFASAAAAICVSRVGLRGVARSRREIERLLATNR